LLHVVPVLRVLLTGSRGQRLQFKVVVPLLAVTQITLRRPATVTGFNSALILGPEPITQMPTTHCHPHADRKHDEDDRDNDRNDNA
ncbi:hypothetical protein, partial [Streptomyces sp. NPDC057460]|uniref:hypothetical protein n=1 Tax=Streptomyces sp. NPDC057460 TaxID=3346141 RepID=UPI00368FD7FC